MTSTDTFDASFRCGSRQASGGITNPYILRFGTQHFALQYDTIMSSLFNGLTIGPVSMQTTPNYSIPAGTTDVSCAVKVGTGYSTNNSCSIHACSGSNCSTPQTFVVVHSGNIVCTTNDEDDYNIGCNPDAPEAVRKSCTDWFQSIFNKPENVGKTSFSMPFIINNIDRTINCEKYAAGTMPGGLNMYDNYVCTTKLPNGQTVDLLSGDRSLQTTAYTVRKDRDNPEISEVSYYVDAAHTAVVDPHRWQNKPVYAEVTCSDSPRDESLSCACANTVDPSSTGGSDAWSQGILDD